MIIFIVALLFVVTGTVFVNITMVNSTKNNIIDIKNINENKRYDAILVLGCKAYEDRPSMMLEKRLDKAIEVYNRLATKILISGDHAKNDYDEVNIMKNYLLEQDVNVKDIFQDHAGLSTYDSIYRAKYVFNAKSIIIVTQKYHLPRALYLADKIGIEAIGIIAEDIPYKSIMLKNEIREVFARDKNFIKAIFKPQSKYVGESISLEQDGNITNG